MSISPQPQSFSERQAAYAAWKSRLRTDKADQKVIDLTDEDAEPAVDEWSTEALFAESRRVAAEDEPTDTPG